MQDDIVRAFESALPDHTVFSGAAIEPKYWHDWSGLPPVQPGLLLRPRSTQDIATALKLCNQIGVRWCPRAVGPVWRAGRIRWKVAWPCRWNV